MAKKRAWRIDPEHDQSAKEFTSVDQLEAFLDAEREFWQWLSQGARRIRQISQRWNKTNNAINSAKQAIKNYSKASDNEEREEHAKAIQRSLNQLKTGVPLFSSDRRAKFIGRLREENTQIAAFALLAFIDPNSVPGNNTLAIRGLVQAQVFEHAISRKGVASRREALENTEKDWGRFLASAQAEYRGFQEEFQSTKKGLEEERKSRKQRFQELEQEWDGRLKSVEQVHREKLALQAPVKYWEDKANQHRKNKWLLVVAFVTGVIAVGLILWSLADSWLLPAIRNQPASEVWLYMALLAAIAGLAIWPLRLLSRSLLSNMHLQSDAEERATMANTYLSLVRSEDIPEAPERELILGALFRPGVTGIVGDDAAPPSTASIVSRLLGGRGGS